MDLVSNKQQLFGREMMDSFGRIRISSPVTVFDSKQLSDNRPLVWDDQQTSGSGTSSTYNNNQSSTTLSVSNLTAGTRVRQTFRRFNYQPGKSQLIMMTGVLGTSNAGNSKQYGLCDGNNGIEFGRDGTGVFVSITSYVTGSPVTTKVYQSNWNIDKMDGTGHTGITLDFTKAQIFLFDFEWLGVGTVSFGIVINRVIYYIHQIHNANNISNVYMSTPNLPMRVLISNNGSGVADSITHICCVIISEGGQEKHGEPFGSTRGITSLTTLNDASIYPLIALRLKSGYLSTNFVPKTATINCTSTSVYNWYLIQNPTFVGTAPVFVDKTYSSMQEWVTSTNATTLSGGVIRATGVTSNSNDSSNLELQIDEIEIGANIAGVSDVLALAVQRITGAAETFYASLNWKEII